MQSPVTQLAVDLQSGQVGGVFASVFAVQPPSEPTYCSIRADGFNAKANLPPTPTPQARALSSKP